MQLNSAVKLQAVIRGHLVRRNAVETLHCIRAIVKVQGLVRARSSKSLVMHSSTVLLHTHCFPLTGIRLCLVVASFSSKLNMFDG